MRGGANAKSIGEKGLIYGDIEPPHNARLDQYVYSGDLIDLVIKPKGHRPMIPTLTNHGIRFGSWSKQKLRLVLANRRLDPHVLHPIRYGDPIYFEFQDQNDPTKTLRWSLDNEVVKANDIGKIMTLGGRKGFVSLGDQVTIQIDPKTWVGMSLDRGLRLVKTPIKSVKMTIEGNLGCGPNWFDDRDTRGTYGQKINLSQWRQFKETLDCQRRLKIEMAINEQLKSKLK